jgi:hypothetical protein
LVAIGLLAWLAQALHFTEEYVAGFWRAFPAILGLEPWSRGAFALFNVAWLLIWLPAIWAAARGHRFAEWPLWFLALALTLNGVAHPILSLFTEGYFPGLWTALFGGIVGAALLRGLARVSRPPTSAPAVESGHR